MGNLPYGALGLIDAPHTCNGLTLFSFRPTDGPEDGSQDKFMSFLIERTETTNRFWINFETLEDETEKPGPKISHPKESNVFIAFDLHDIKSCILQTEKIIGDLFENIEDDTGMYAYHLDLKGTIISKDLDRSPRNVLFQMDEVEYSIKISIKIDLCGTFVLTTPLDPETLEALTFQIPTPGTEQHYPHTFNKTLTGTRMRLRPYEGGGVTVADLGDTVRRLVFTTESLPTAETHTLLGGAAGAVSHTLKGASCLGATRTR